MSAKYLKKKKKKPLLWILVLVLALAAAAIVLTLTSAEKPEIPNQPSVNATQENTQQAVPETEERKEMAELPIDLGEDLVITNISSYAGLYLEDGTDEVVSGILMLELENRSDMDLQLAKITLDYQGESATFTVTNLPSGKKVVLLEENRSEYTAQAPRSAKAENTVFLQSFDMHEDTLQITALDGVINVKNISDSDIGSDIFVYYKNVVGDVYYGGITYRVRIEGGLKAGEIRQIMTQHYTADGSEILMVSYVE